MGSKYLNVDVEVRSSSDLAPLRDELGASVDIMFCGEVEPGKYLFSFEVPAWQNDSDPDKTVKSLCKLIGELKGRGREAWLSADDRVFDFGFDAVLDSKIGQPVLSPEALQRIGSLNARMAVSVYTVSLQEAHK